MSAVDPLWINPTSAPDLGYLNTFPDRATATGDRLLEEDTPVRSSGLPEQPVPPFRENRGGGEDQTAILCNPKNMHVGIRRPIRLESDRDISNGALTIVATLRVDAKFAEKPCVTTPST